LTLISPDQSVSIDAIVDNNGHYSRFAMRIYSWLIDPLLRSLRPRVVNVCRRRNLRSVLDIASGTGAQCILLDHAGIQATGIDLSKAMIDCASRRSPPTIRYVHGSAFELPFDDDAFEGVLLLLALHEHSERERLAMLSEAQRVLMHNGCLVLAEYSVPKNVATNISWWVIRIIEWLAGGDHRRNFHEFASSGGIKGLESRTLLKVLERQSSHRGTIEIVVASFS